MFIIGNSMLYKKNNREKLEFFKRDILPPHQSPRDVILVGDEKESEDRNSWRKKRGCSLLICGYIMRLVHFLKVNAP